MSLKQTKHCDFCNKEMPLNDKPKALIAIELIGKGKGPGGKDNKVYTELMVEMTPEFSGAWDVCDTCFDYAIRHANHEGGVKVIYD